MGDWNDTSNWAPVRIPNAIGQSATFGDSPEPQTVFTDSAVTVKQITFDSSEPYSVTGTGSVNLESDDDVGQTTIVIGQGDHRFQETCDVKL